MSSAVRFFVFDPSALSTLNGLGHGGSTEEGTQKDKKKKNTKTGEENKARSRPQTIAEEKLHQIPERERRLHNSTQEHRKNDLILFSRRGQVWLLNRVVHKEQNIRQR